MTPGDVYVDEYLHKTRSYEIKPISEWVLELAELISVDYADENGEVTEETVSDCVQISLGALRLMFQHKAIEVRPFWACTVDEAKRFYQYFTTDARVCALPFPPETAEDSKLLALVFSGLCARKLATPEEVDRILNGEEQRHRKNKREDSYANEAEKKLKEWLDHHNYAFHYINQSPDTYAVACKAMNIKRPDFTVTTKLGGAIAVDVKDRELRKAFNSVVLDTADDIEKYQEYECTFHQQVWFAFHVEGTSFDTFYWISFQDVMNKTVERISSESGNPFRPIPLDLCTKITWEDSIAKLL